MSGSRAWRSCVLEQSTRALGVLLSSAVATTSQTIGTVRVSVLKIATWRLAGLLWRSGPRRTRGHRPHIGAAATRTRRSPCARVTQSPRRRTRSRRRRHAGHGGLLRPLWHHQIVLLLATDAPPIRREAWATLQEWAVCSSIFVVGRGVKAGRAGSTPRDTLNARSERGARSRRPSGRRTAYMCAASSAAALAVPQPQRCPAVASLKQLWRKRRRQHRAAGGLVAPCDSVDASAAPRALDGAACSSTQVAEQWARCWHAAIRTRSHAFHL